MRPTKHTESCHLGRLCFVLLAVVACSGVRGQVPVKRGKAQGAIAETGLLSTTNGSASGQPTATSPAAAASLAALPTPIPPELLRDIDINSQVKAILAHLNEVIRYYRMSAVPIQRVGELSDSVYAQQAQSEATNAGQFAFKSARGQAGFLARVRASQGDSGTDTSIEARKVSSQTEAAEKRLAALQLQQATLLGQMRTTGKSQQDALQARQADVEGQIKVNKALFDALSKLMTGPNAQQTEL